MRAQPTSPSLKPQRCLVTGATGFVGSRVVSMLLEQRCNVAILVRDGADCWRIQDQLSSLHRLSGNLTDIGSLRPRVLDFAPEVLIHAGWEGVTQRSRGEPSQIKTNLYGSLELLSACLEAGCELAIGLGSQAEYGTTDQLLVETMAARPDTMYGVAKLCTGLLWQQMCTAAGVRPCWLRLTAAYGPKDDPGHLIPYVISSLLSGTEPALTAGGQKWDYLYVDDVAQAVLSVMNHPAARGIFNLSSETAVSVKELCGALRDRIDPGLRLGFGKMAVEAEARDFMGADSSRFRSVTGWKPQVSLDEGIEHTVEWHRKEMLSQH